MTEYLLAAAPWMAIALLAVWRNRGSPSLSGFPPTEEMQRGTLPLLSIVVPARNEELNIARCITSIRQSGYENLEIIVLDDHSVDATGAVALNAAEGDNRVRLLVPPPLAEGWMGKSWACWNGMMKTSGEFVLFTDADTWHHPQLHGRMLAAMQQMNCDMLSVLGTQEMETFWERLLQPLVFLLLILRFGGAGQVNRSTRRQDKLANGQCILVRRAAYEKAGGHRAASASVVEDLKLAQNFHLAGLRTMLVRGETYLRTRMYRSLAELVHGWGKNVYAGALEAVPANSFVRIVLVPVLLLAAPLVWLIVPLLALLTVAGVPVADPGATTVSALTLTALIGAYYTAHRVNPLYSLLLPLGGGVLLGIVVGAIARGRHVSWKGRNYTSG